MNEERRTVLLDFDGVLLMPAFNNHTETIAHQNKTEPARTDVLPWINTAPPDIEHVTLTGLADRPVWGVIRRDTIERLHALSSEIGVELVWASSWLTRPDCLREASAQIGLDFIRFPNLDGIYPENRPLMGIRAHWKTALAMQYVDAGCRVLWVDDQLEEQPAQEYLKRLSIVAPTTYHGLNAVHLELMQQWVGGRDLAVFDNATWGGWHGSTAC